MKRLAFILITFVLGISATPVQKTVNALDSKGGALEHSTWGILAVNFQGDTIAQLNIGKRLVPASNMKLVTTAAAYLKLGRGYTFKTQIATDGAIQDSTLVDFSGELRHTDWSTEDERSKDGVVPSGLTWRGKMGDSIPDGPLAAAMHFRRWLIQSGVPVSGAATASQESVVRSATATHGLAQKTSANDSSCAATIPDSLVILGTAQSATLNHIATITNHQSDNFCAETLLKAIGKANNGSDDYDTATAALHRALAPIGLAGPSAGMRFADGSGLSRKNFVSPEFLVRILTGMARTSSYKDYLNSLPRPGRKDGTLQTRLPKAPAAVKNRIYMKSGSMGGVRCFSGYILPSDGDARKTIAFSIMVNNHVGRQADLAPVLDNLILELANVN